MAIDAEDVIAFIAARKLAVVATRAGEEDVEAALVGFALTADFGIVFDTQSTSRKAANLRVTPRAAAVVGWDDESTVQIEGDVAEPTGTALAAAREAYFAVWPDGRERAGSPDITHFVIAPRWLRYSSYEAGPAVVEFTISGTDWTRV